MARVFGLDALRATAVLMVVVAHGRYLILPLLPSASCLSIFGFLGVELFFVLSGFLIGGILLRSFPESPTSRTLLHFWIRRWFRTLPNYYAFLALNTGIVLALGAALPSPLGYLAFLQNLTGPPPHFFTESWSLAIEEWFYLLFPILLLVLTRLGLSLRAACAAAMLALLAFSTGGRIAAASAVDPAWDRGDMRMVVLFRLDALMFGVLGAWTKFHFEPSWRRLRRPGIALGVLLAAVVVTAYYGTSRNASSARVWLFTATSLAVLALLPALDAWRGASGRLAHGVERISLWSYSLYLCHMPVARVLKALLGDPLVLTATYFALSIGMAALVYRFFERPAMQLRERFREPSAAAQPAVVRELRA